MLLIWFHYEYSVYIYNLIPEKIKNILYWLSIIILFASFLSYKIETMSTYKYLKIKVRYINLIEKIMIILSPIVLYQKRIIKNNLFFKEGMYLDVLQKLFLDKLFRFFLFQSTQLFNLNFFYTYLIKLLVYVINSNIWNFNLNEDDISIMIILMDLLILFLCINQIYYIIKLNIWILF